MTLEALDPNQDVLQRAVATMKAQRKRLGELEAERREPIAIIGMSCRFPGPAADLAGYWRVLEGAMALDRLDRRFDAAALDGIPPFAGLLPSITDFDPAVFGMTPREAAALDPQQRLLLELAWEALEHAGYAPTAVRAQPAGVFLGVTSVDFRELLGASTGALDAHALTGTTNCFAAGRISYALGLDGPAIVVDTACSSSLVAVHLACQSLRCRESKLALAGGVNIIASPLALQLLAKTGALSPTGECRPFDAGANGFVRGEGGGMIVLKRLRDALAEGDPVLAVIAGSAVNQDGRSMNLTSPNPDAQIRLLRAALEAAGVDPEEVGYVEAHGTGTSLGDPMELEALGDVLGYVDGPLCYIGSVKANLGHLEAAAGIAGLVRVVLSMRKRCIPRQANFAQLNPHISLDGTRLAIATEAIAWPEGARPRTAGLSSFGLSGTNAHVILQEPPRRPRPAAARERTRHVLALSARTPEALGELAARYRAVLESPEAPELADVCFTTNTGRAQFRHRAALVAGSVEDMAARAAALASGGGPGVFRGTASTETAPRIAFLFTGQDAPYEGMGRVLYDCLPEVRRILDTCDEILRPLLRGSLLDALYPSAADGRLRRTAYGQPAIFALEYAIAKLWMSYGVQPAAVLGHGVGEYTAACVAGVFPLEDGLALMAERGRLMEEHTEEGAMAMVFCDRRRLEHELAAHAADLALAAVNGPGNVVISGRREPLARLCARLEADGERVQMLPVTRGFHSPLMAPILPDLERAASRIAHRPPRIPVISSVTGQVVSGDAIGPAYWRAHAAEPVRFADGLRTLVGEGYRTLIEVGPTATPIELVQQTLDAGPALRLVPSLREGKDDLEVLLESLAALYVDGVDVSWDGFDAAFDRRRVELPSYPFQRRRYWMFSGADAAASAAASRRAPVEPSPDARPAAAELPVSPGAVAAAAMALRAELRACDDAGRAHRVEAVILDLAAAVLGLARDEIERGVPLQNMGLDSLIAVALRTQIDRAFGVSLTLMAFLDTPSIATLTQHVLALLPEQERGRDDAAPDALASEASGPSEAVVVVANPTDAHQPFRLTDLQQAYLIGRSGTFELGNVPTCFLFEFDVVGLDRSRLEASLGQVIARHAMLRAVVLPEGMQQVLPEVPPYEIEVADLRPLDSDAREQRLLDTRRELAEHTFDTRCWPLFRVRVSQTIGNRARLHIVMDALIADGWSTSILFREWGALYRDPDRSLPPVGLTYRDYVAALATLEHTEAYAAALAYWQARLVALPPPPDLPLARPPSSIDRPRFSHRQARLDAASWAGFKDRAQRHGVTLSAAVCAVYAEVLAAWSKSSHFTLNLLALNRLQLHPEVSSVIGNFSATTLLEVEVRAGQPFVDHARQLQHQLWSDLEHSLVSGVRVLRELNRAQHTAGRAGMPVVFASMLNFGGSDPGKPGLLRQLAGLGEELREVHCSVRTPQVWLDHQVLEDAGELVLNWDAVEELFPPGMVSDMLQAYVQRLERLAADDAAWRSATGPLVPPAQRELRTAVNDTVGPLREALLHQPFLERVAEDPGRLAVISGRRSLTYGEVDQLSDRVAHWLHALGARPNRLVAITMEKGWEQVVAAIAVLKAGAAYVPVDSALPAERLRHLLGHAEVDCVLTQRHIDGRVAWPAGIRRLCVDEADALPHAAALAAAAGPRNLAYVIYTSGSTGLPKGVMIEHRAALNTILDVNQRFGVSAEDRVLGLSSLSFDLSVYDVFGMLAAGGALVLPAAEDLREPGRWIELIASSGITIWNSVPALMEMLVDHCAAHTVRDALPLRVVMLSGDWIPLALVPRISRLAPGARSISLGGATEASIWSIFHPIERVEPGWTSIPYGKPLRNQRFAVLDGAMQPRPVWVTGDLYIAGDGLASGYWRDDDKTAASFSLHPQTGERLYRTGDLGRYLPDGSIEFLGRADFQVKINGYRIELGEIDAALAQQTGVRAAVAAAIGDRGNQRLVVYAVPAPGVALSEADLIAGLASKLPSYAVPHQVVVLDALPLSANGKVDRRALPTPGLRSTGRAHTLARTETEQTLVALWRELLGKDEVGVTDNFFELGGQSLLAVRLMGQIRQRYAMSAPLATLFERPTIEQLAELIDAKGGSSAPQRHALVALRDGGHRPPLFFVHPVGGDVLCYAELARSLGPDQPFFGLQALDPGSGREAGPEPGSARGEATISGMAETYLAALRERQASGPYFLGGWSMGGVVAYEIAQRLRSAGAHVALLALVDVSMMPSGERPEIDDPDLFLALGHDLAGLARPGSDLDLDGDRIRPLAEPERLAYFLAWAQEHGVLPDEMDRGTLAGYFDRFRRNYRAMLAYHAARYDGRMVFVRAHHNGASVEIARAWSALSPRAEVIDVDGDHYAITRSDGARAIANLISARMRIAHPGAAPLGTALRARDATG